MYKNFILLSIVMTYFFSMSIPSLFAFPGPPPDEVQNAAVEGLNVFVKGRKIESLTRFGFKSQAEIDNSVVGEGFEVFTIDDDKLMDESLPQDLQSRVSTTKEWFFLVRSNNDPKCVVKVDFDEEKGKWAPFGMGSPKMASDMVETSKIWPPYQGYQIRYIRMYSSVSTILELYKDGESIGIFPAKHLLKLAKKDDKNFDPRTLIEPKDLLSNLRAGVKQEREDYKEMLKGKRPGRRKEEKK